MRGYADSSTTRADCSKEYEQVTVPLVHFLHIGLDSSHYDTSDSRISSYGEVVPSSSVLYFDDSQFAFSDGSV